MRKLAASLTSTACAVLSSFRALGVCELPEAPFQRDSYSCKRVTKVTSGHPLTLIFGILRKVLSRTIEPLQGF